jgi:hypothetical protein
MFSTETIAQFADIKDLARNPYAWPGGYPRFAIMSDGESLCPACVKSEWSLIARAIADQDSSGWQAVAGDVNWEDSTLCCAHCNKAIPSAYGEEEEDPESDEPDLSKADLLFDSNRGQFIPQHFAEEIARDRVTGVSDEQYDILAAGPDGESYWDVWCEVTDSAVLSVDGKTGRLYQDGDVWIIFGESA